MSQNMNGKKIYTAKIVRPVQSKQDEYTAIVNPVIANPIEHKVRVPLPNTEFSPAEEIKVYRRIPEGGYHEISVTAINGNRVKIVTNKNERIAKAHKIFDYLNIQEDNSIDRTIESYKKYIKLKNTYTKHVN